MRISYNQRRNYLHHELQRMNLPCFKPQGAFYMFPVSGIRDDERRICTEAAESEKLAVIPGSAFGERAAKLPSSAFLCIFYPGIKKKP